MTLTLIAAGLLAQGALGAPEFQAPDGAVQLAPRAFRTWSIALPADPFRTVTGAIPVPHANGDGFAVEARGVGLAVDTDGDGELDRVIEGREHPETKVRQARVVLTGKQADGSELRYAVRLESAGGGWKWAPGGALVGDLDGTPIQLVDLDGNGSHGDVGRDAIVVGGTDIAQFLGETIAVDGRLVSISVEGDTLTAAPYAGETGILDLHSEFGGKGVLLAAVVKSVDGRQSFELSEHGEGLAVPAGRYRLVSAELGLGDARVTVDPAGMKPIAVGAEGRAALAWGAPVKASFAYRQNGSEVVLDPAQVQYIGAAGEQWLGWDPIGKSPKFRIKEKDTGDVLVDVVFPGSC